MTDQSIPAVWVDGDPLMEKIAAAVWEQCQQHDSGLVVDDPRNIAAVAATVARAQPASTAVVPAADQAAEWSAAARFVEAMNEACDQRPCEACTTREDVASELRRVAAEAAAVVGVTADTTPAFEADRDSNTTPKADPKAETPVHACPVDGTGITGCCGRVPFELPRTDRMTRDPDAVTCTGPVVPAQPGNDTKTQPIPDGRCAACGHTVCDGDGPCGARAGSDFCTCPGPQQPKEA
ncbi:hypothetical protein PV377_47335 [Streptomyces ipomoeae]|uniref:hypothetical protein n=1 Tax=Streptomyces ipomoeae TaxID=103232 RepID=UPI0029AB92A3|nr:hypothetical protein [Streptomyces ipomoeae]MDX2846434.1 hypothetical protein [Streptomyces ipomoeae]